MQSPSTGLNTVLQCSFTKQEKRDILKYELFLILRLLIDPPIMPFNQSRCFECLDGTMIVPRQKVCDGVINCSDLSDECLCSGEVPKVCDAVVKKSLATSSK